VREKSAIKKTKVHKALKIRTSSDSGENPKPKETLVPEKEVLVEKDQSTSTQKDGAPGPKEDPLLENEPLVEDQSANDEGKQDHVQKDGITLMTDDPNAEKKEDESLTNSEVKDKKVSFTLFSQLYSFFEPLTVLTNPSFCICRMNRKRRLPKQKISKVQKGYHYLLQITIKLMKTRALEMMGLTRLMATGSKRKRPMRSQMKRMEMSLRSVLIVVMLRFYQQFQASTTHYPTLPPNLDKPVRPKNLPMTLKVFLKLRLVVQI
jgi:hypothetical protein